MECFSDTEKIIDLVSGNNFVEVTDVVYSENFADAQVILEGIEHLRLFGVVLEHGWVGSARNAEHDALLVFEDVKKRQVTRVGKEDIVVEIEKAVNFIVRDVADVVVREQFDPVDVIEFAAFVKHLFLEVFMEGDGESCRNDFRHAQLNGGDHVIVEHAVAEVGDVAVVAFGKRMLDVEDGARIEVVDGFRHDHAERADVGAHADGVGKVKKLNGLRFEDLKSKPLFLIVDECDNHVRSVLEFGDAVTNLEQGSSNGERIVGGGVTAEDFDLFIHSFSGI